MATTGDAASSAQSGEPAIAVGDAVSGLDAAAAEAPSAEAVVGSGPGREQRPAADDPVARPEESADPSLAASAATARAAVGENRSAQYAAISDRSAPGRAGTGGATSAGSTPDGTAPVIQAWDPEGSLERGASGSGPRAAAEQLSHGRAGETVSAPLATGGVGSDDSLGLAERGLASAELRAADRPLTERPLTELTAGDRGPRLTVQQFAGQAGWGEEIQGRLQWLSRQGLQRAELQLHPAELGSVDVRITAENDQTSVVFTAANRSARELLEAEIPRLRELFAQAGVELGQVEVSDRQPGERQQFTARDESYDGGHGSPVKRGREDADTELAESNLPSAGGEDGRGIIDHYI
jgi:flagellar hook-length control protein FliK